MNRERLEKLMKGLELQATDESWDYRDVFASLDRLGKIMAIGMVTPGCGTLGCAIGHMPLIFDDFPVNAARLDPAVEFLGINEEQGCALFCDMANRKNMASITRFDIADRIRRLLANPNATRDEIVGLR